MEYDDKKLNLEEMPEIQDILETIEKTTDKLVSQINDALYGNENIKNNSDLYHFFAHLRHRTENTHTMLLCNMFPERYA